MVERFEWVPDVARGEWLRPLEAEPLGSILSIVPRGFEAYARVFHPVERDRPRDIKSWQGVDQQNYFADVEDIEASIESERATWAQAAESFGTTMHPQAQYAPLVRRNYGDANGVIAPDGWRYLATSEGSLDAISLSAIAKVLAGYTATPDAGIAAVWEGWGGLVSSAGLAYFSFPEDDQAPVRKGNKSLSRVLTRLSKAARQVFAKVRSKLKYLLLHAGRQAKPGSGILSTRAASGPRFDLHGTSGRHYVLFEAGASDFADPQWASHAPWVDEPMWAQSPSIVWPDDHAWVLATEIDFDSTLIAGTHELIQELMQTPGIEVLPIETNADLTWEGDKLNRPE